MTCEGDLNGIRITPLILLPFVENLFKYAELTDPNCPAEIAIQATEQTLTFTTSNKKRKTISFLSPGIGIENIKTRLKAQYPERHELCIRNEENRFDVQLTIEQNQQPC